MDRYINILLTLLFAGVLILPATAQNNPYKIDDSLYPFLQKAIKMRNNPQSLLIADTLYDKATRLGDKKAQCLATTIPISYYYNKNDYDKLVQAVEKSKKEARRNNYLQYYYSACTQHINWLLNHGHSLRALQKAEKMKEQAFNDQHAYGILSCIRALGNIYYIRWDMDMAAKYYTKALEYMLKELPEQDPAYLYINLSEYHRNKANHEKALEYAEKAIKTAKTDESHTVSLMEKCEVLYRLNRIDDFNACFDKCMQQVERYGNIRNFTFQRLRAYKYILEGNYERALVMADSVGRKMAIYQIRQAIYLKAGNYERAYTYANYIHQYQDSINRLVQSSDLAELNAQIGNERMKAEAKALEMKNTELNLANTRLELERARSEVELERINAENSQLALENKNLELARLNTEAEKQKAILKEQQITSQHHIVTLSLTLSFLFLFTCFLILYLYRRRKATAMLKEKNQELTVARDHAEQSDKMKTFFIQNMSHEIRTPLNAIVGFSQILSTPEMEVGDEERQEFSRLIQVNSELLTTLVNDLLDLSYLESGNYTMQLASHPCNKICRTAIASVVHRKPENVKLVFTSDVPDDFRLLTDEKRLQQVLINFLTNAEKHTQKGEIQLHCSLTENPGKMTFSVTDTGSGVPADRADYIFKRFSKLDEFKQGTGLGLNICLIIAEHLKGEVKLDKNYTKGARFLFILPLDKKETKRSSNS